MRSRLCVVGRVILPCVALMCVLVSSADAIPPFWKEFESQFVAVNPNPKFVETATAAKCNVCHVKDQKKTERNAFGQQLSQLLDKKKDKANIAKIRAALAFVATIRPNPDDENGATFGALIAGGSLPGDASSGSAGGSVAENKPAASDEPQELTAAAKEAIAKIEELGGSVRPIALNDASLDVDFHLGGKELNDEGLALVTALPRVVHLHLKDTKITDEGLAQVGSIESLQRLHLEKTKITDQGLPHLKSLANLEYLNVYGTDITDAGLDVLAELKGLKKLYIWQTKVTIPGCNKLKAARPDLEVIPDLELEKKRAAEEVIRKAEEAKRKAEEEKKKAEEEKKKKEEEEKKKKEEEAKKKEEEDKKEADKKEEPKDKEKKEEPKADN